MDQQQPPSSRMVWPGFGLVVGAGVGSVLGLLVDASTFFLWAAGGAGVGLVAGAIVDLLARR